MPGEVHSYTLTIKFIETGLSQNSNQGATFNGTIQVREGFGNDLELAIVIDGQIASELPSSGYYKLVSSTCENNSIIEWRTFNQQIYINKAKLPESCSLEFEEIDSSLIGQILESNPLKSGTPSYSGIATSSDTGLYKAQDDYGESYYFRGLKTNLNNNVIFGGYQWKIIRITGSGDIKLIYNGECSSIPCTINDTNTNTQIGAIAFNATVNGNRAVGYMYGAVSGTYEQQHANTTNSTIKGVVDTWYDGLRPGAKAFVADTIYCNDRSLSSGNGLGYTSTNYGAYGRLQTNKTPTLKCPQKNDAFTVSDAIGNGALTHPVGLITADEVAMAGGVCEMTANTTFYLYTGQMYWTMSPNSYSSIEPAVTYGLLVFANGRLSNYGVNIGYGVRPVIALKSTVEITGGNGSATDPYVVKE